MLDMVAVLRSLLFHRGKLVSEPPNELLPGHLLSKIVTVDGSATPQLTVFLLRGLGRIAPY